MNNLQNAQRIYRNVNRRWIGGYVSDFDMYRQTNELADAYCDAYAGTPQLTARYQILAKRYRGLANELYSNLKG